jgi:chromosome partitioning protein
MTVVSVINYKGGVGKTTLTANIGAELAARGRTVLLVDLDPQASLTFSFFAADEWEKNLADSSTILQWFGTLLEGAPQPLRGYVLTPPVVDNLIQTQGGGRLDLIASHLDLVDVDLELAFRLGGSQLQRTSPEYVGLHRALRDALSGPDFAAYDVVLLDCPPNFTMSTRTAIVASDYLLVPARPDHLSTLGIDYLRQRLSGLVLEYNKAVASPAEEINPTILGVVFTMIQYASSGEPITAMGSFLGYPAKYEIDVFAQRVRDNKTLFGRAGENGIPAVLVGDASDAGRTAQFELQQLASEFLAKIRV